MSRVRYFILIAVLCGLAAACADTSNSTTQPSSIRQRQQEALRDPYGYGPSDDMPSVSGGGTTKLDKKGLRRDWDSFWNP